MVPFYIVLIMTGRSTPVNIMKYSSVINLLSVPLVLRFIFETLPTDIQIIRFTLIYVTKGTGYRQHIPIAVIRHLYANRIIGH